MLKKFKKGNEVNIEALDLLIAKINSKLLDFDSQTGEEYGTLVRRLDELVRIRAELGDVKTRESIKPQVISGAIHVGGILLVLYYEKADVVMSKAYNMATSFMKRM